jgi:hypothetical protein
MRIFFRCGLFFVVLLSGFSGFVYARIGENLSQCETRYGPSKALEVPSELALAGVGAYEFRRDPYTIVTLIGSAQGAFRISYFKKGGFSEVEALDLMKRNWSGPGDEIESLGSMPALGAGPRMSWWIGPAGDSSALDGILTTGRTQSELAIISTRRLLQQSARPMTLDDCATDFFVEYLKMLDAEAVSDASSATSERNEGL